LFYGRRAQLDALEDGGTEDIDTSIDAVSNEFDRFLDKSVNSRRVIGLVYYDTVFRGFFDLSNHNCTFLAVLLVEFGQIRKRVFADDIGVQYKEWGVVFSKNLFRKLEGSGCAKGF
jgi:hypothetical protein